MSFAIFIPPVYPSDSPIKRPAKNIKIAPSISFHLGSLIISMEYT